MDFRKSGRFCTGKCVKFSYIYIKNAIVNSEKDHQIYFGNNFEQGLRNRIFSGEAAEKKIIIYDFLYNC